MASRAACRLETLGFAEVYDYEAGKVDWLVHQRPIEGERSEEPTVGQHARDDVVLCTLKDQAGRIRELVESSPYPFALVKDARGVLLGRLRASMLDCDPALRAEEVMEGGPSTVRPHKTAAGVAQTLAEKNLRWAIVTTPRGELLGVAARSELEEAAQRASLKRPA
jgi:predicted transcriptional regulator